MSDSFFTELKRRNVLRVFVAYVALGWLVLQIADVLTPAFNLPEWTLRFLLIVGLLGLPFVLFFSWAFELTPEGIVREEDVDRKKSITDVTAKKLNYITIGLLVVLIAVSLIRPQYNSQQRDEVTTEVSEQPLTAPETKAMDETSIAVLPFENMSSDPEQEYFSDGISEELLNLLAKIPELKVAARTSSFRFKGTKEDIQSIAQQLGVAHVLEGSIRKSGNKIRITAQLIHAEDGFHLWSETYDEELTDIFVIQDKISAAIVDSLKESLGIELKKVNTQISDIDPVAHDYYLRGQSLIKSASFEDLRQAVDYLQLAVNLEPEFLPARLELVYAILGRYTIGDIEGSTQLPLAESLLDGIFERDPDNATATYYLAILLKALNREEEGVKAFERAIALDSKNPELFWVIGFYGFNGALNHLINKDTLQESFDYLIDRDPYNVFLYFDWARINRWIYLDFDVAMATYLRGTEIQPDNGNPIFGVGLLYSYELGDIVSGIPYFIRTQNLDKSDPDASIFLSKSYLALGDIEQAAAWADEAVEILPESGQAIEVKVMTLFAEEKKQEAYALILNTLGDDSIFYRRGSKMSLLRLGAFYLLKNDRALEAKNLMAKYEPRVEDAYDLSSDIKLGNGFPAIIATLSVIERKLGNEDIYRQLTSRLSAITPDDVQNLKPELSLFDHFRLASLNDDTANLAQTFDYLEKSVEMGFYMDWQERFLWNPRYIDLQDEPRFKALIKKIEDEMTRQRQFLNDGT